MNTKTKLPLKLSIVLLICILIGCGQSDKQPDKEKLEKHIVLVKFKAQPEKGEVSVTEITKLIENVKHEPHFIEIKLHVDPKDNTNILLYEEWENADYYNTDHMETAHIKEFIKNSENFLAGPPEITQWDVKRVFK